MLIDIHITLIHITNIGRGKKTTITVSRPTISKRKSTGKNNWHKQQSVIPTIIIGTHQTQTEKGNYWQAKTE